MGLVHHERIAVEPRVLRGIGNEQEVLFKDGLGTEGTLQGRLAHPEPDLRFEELSSIANEIHDRDGHFAQLGCQCRHLVEGCFARGVENIVAGKRSHPLFFEVVRLCHITQVPVQP